MERAAVDEFCNLPTDVLVEILLRVPPGNLCRLRFVCRRWRAVIRERLPRAPDEERPVALAFVVNCSVNRSVWASAYVVDDLLEGRCRELWRSEVVPPTRRYRSGSWWDVSVEEGARPAMVGTCNGLLCLCDDAKPGGAISLVNPVSRETVAVPPQPGSAQWVLTGIRAWHEAYSFAYDPATERYWVVHVPCYLDRTGGFNVLHVFTLGAASGWRDVSVPGGSCRVDAGLVSIGGVTHWVTRETERVVSFDLGEERVASTTTLPPVRIGHGRCRLAEVHGRLGVVADDAVDGWSMPGKVEVWVLGAAGSGRDRRQVWSRRYNVQVVGVKQRLAWPHFAHGGHALTMDSKCVFTHRMRAAGALQCGEVPSVRISEEGQVKLSGINGGSIRGVFAYVKTQDPLSAYRSQAS